MQREGYVDGPLLIPLEDLLQWNEYQYGNCYVKIKGIYYPLPTARHIGTGQYTYADTEEDLFRVLEASRHFEKYDEMPKLPKKLISKVKTLTHKPERKS